MYSFEFFLIFICWRRMWKHTVCICNSGGQLIISVAFVSCCPRVSRSFNRPYYYEWFEYFDICAMRSHITYYMPFHLPRVTPHASTHWPKIENKKIENAKNKRSWLERNKLRAVVHGPWRIEQIYILTVYVSTNMFCIILPHIIMCLANMLAPMYWIS